MFKGAVVFTSSTCSLNKINPSFSNLPTPGSPPLTPPAPPGWLEGPSTTPTAVRSLGKKQPKRGYTVLYSVSKRAGRGRSGAASCPYSAHVGSDALTSAGAGKLLSHVAPRRKHRHLSPSPRLQSSVATSHRAELNLPPAAARLTHTTAPLTHGALIGSARLTTRAWTQKLEIVFENEIN